jgi:sugar-specific transcriptional regulator TrmB
MINSLKNVGLDEKTAKVYMAVLALGTSSVKTIAEKAELKRPTVYLHLDELIQKGFIQRITIGKREYYHVIDPKLVEKKLEEGLQEWKKEVKEFEKLREGQGKPSVTVFEGEKGLNQVYEEIKNVRELMFWSDLSSVERKFPGIFQKINQATIDNKIFTREIIADTPEARQSSKRWAATAGEMYLSRLASGPIFNDTVIYGNVVAFFRLQDYNLFVVRIEDTTIAETTKTLFEMAWRSAKPFVSK